ncbi:U3 small nucleolar RNA-associated protein 11 [Dirofilaria immitis]|nr:U3 small nucleolar RNA-associated protein 11 [Dirofilaria immitis]
MSSLKRSSKVGQRIHRERPQPESRAHLGLLEKKKDYVQRARDYNYKKRKLQRLRQKALSRNPDEFHFHMIRSHVGEDGVHHENTPEPDEDTLLQKKLTNIEDLKYVKHRLNIENQKIEKLRATLHFADTVVAKIHILFSWIRRKKMRDEAVPESCNFCVFFFRKVVKMISILDNKNFDPVKYFDTSEEILNRRYNRPRISTLQNSSIVNAKTRDDVKQADHERQKMYSELLKRMQRAKELKIVVEKLEVSKGEPMKAPVYKWVYERKK